MPTAVTHKKSEPKATGTHTRAAQTNAATSLMTPDSIPLVQHKASCSCGGGCPRCQANAYGVQAKLRISSPGDKYELEADRVADRVVNGKKVDQPLSTLSSQLQRKPLETDESREEQEEEEATEELNLQTKLATTPSENGSVSEAELNNLQGKGEALPHALRSDLENSMGYDFKHVRIHRDSSAASLAHNLNARAFTLRNNVVFGQNQYEPSSSQGRHLLAHELTHVVQQTGTLTRRTTVANQIITPSRPAVQRKADPAKCRKTGLKQTQCDLIDGDNYNAMLLIMLTMKELRKPKYTRKVKKALKCYFNIKNYAYRKKLISNLQEIQTWLAVYRSSVYYKKGHPNGCKRTPAGITLAYARPAPRHQGRIFGQSRIGICPIYFKNLPNGRRIMGLIHEQAHVVGHVPKTGAKELRVSSRRRKTLPTARLLKSADGYAHFVIAVTTGKFFGC